MGEWFDRLDGWGAAELGHREIARRVAAELGIDPLAWNAQAITMGYERARGLRAVGEHSDGFTVTAADRGRAGRAAVRRVRRRRAARALAARRRRCASARRRDRGPPASTGAPTGAGHVTFLAKGGQGSTVALEHARLADAGEAERMKAFWRERLGALRSQLAAGGRRCLRWSFRRSSPRPAPPSSRARSTTACWGSGWPR